MSAEAKPIMGIIEPPQALSRFERAQLNLTAFAALHSHGHVREDGKWQKWDNTERRQRALELANWASGTPFHCDFCGKSQHEVGKLIAGPSAFICDECSRLCNQIIDENNEALKAAAVFAEERANDICAACGMPRREHQPGGKRWGETSLCGVFIPVAEELGTNG